MIQISAFADEIAADLEEQITVLRGEGIAHIELRGIWRTGVLDLSEAQVTHARRALDASGIRVSAIGSPIGKAPIDADFDEHLQRFERALRRAAEFETRYIRIFSFYPPATDPLADPASYRAEVLRRLRELTARARDAGVVLLHENEKDIYGDTIARCVDLLRNVDDPRFAAILDPANFIQCEQRPYPDAYEAVAPWLRYMHVKDALADGTVVAAGEGAAAWPALLTRLREDGYDGFFSLEPHLASAGRFHGYSGPDLFRRASRAFQDLLHSMGWSYV